MKEFARLLILGALLAGAYQVHSQVLAPRSGGLSAVGGTIGLNLDGAGRKLEGAEAIAQAARQMAGLPAQGGYAVLRTQSDALGMQHVRLQQNHAGVPVLGGVVIAHLRAGTLQSLTGRVVPAVSASQPVLDASQALAAAITQSGARQLIWQGPNADLRWVPSPDLWYVPASHGSHAGAYRLAWRVDLYSQEPHFRADCYVDAQTGELIFRNERLHSANAQGIGHTKYSGQQNIVTDSTGSFYRLRETSRAQGVETYDMQNGTDYNSAVDVTQFDNEWDTFASPTKRGALDAHWGAEMTYDYYNLFHGRDSYDDSASKLISYVHYGQNYVNAYWNGVYMTYGDGGGNNNPFSGLDVCGHEFTHGVTEYAAGLVYAYESGALNESFSDIFGNAIEFWSRPGNASWAIGDDIGAFRSMSDPKAHLNPDTYKGSFWEFGGWDNGGVHINSGVQNHWFYLISDGGSGVNDNGDSYAVTGLGIDTAAQIAYRNLNVYLTPLSDFAEARFYSIQSAVDLYGGCSPAMIQTMNAWYAVGVGNPYTGVLVADLYTPDTNLCTLPAEVHFQNLSFSAIGYEWDFGDGGTSTAEHPVHSYQAAGDYTVRLVAIGCQGQRDTIELQQHIHVDPQQACTINMPGSNDTLLQTGCEGFLYDSGGSNDYLDNSNSRVTIDPSGPGNLQVRLEFSSFNYAAGDRITIFDGPATSYPVIGIYAGTNLPPVALSTNGALTVLESTNGANTRDGFSASWNCLEVSAHDPLATGQLRVAPNPSDGRFELNWGRSGAETHLVEVLDATGRTMFSMAGAHVDRWEESLDLRHLAAGVYLLRATAGTDLRVQRIIVQ